MLAAAGAAVYFLRAAETRSPVSPLRAYGVGLTVLGGAAVGSLVAEHSMPLVIVRAVVADTTSVAAGIGTAYAALAVRGRGAALVLACWTAGVVVASAVAGIFNYSVHAAVATVLGVVALVVGPRVTRAAAPNHARFD